MHQTHLTLVPASSSPAAPTHPRKLFWHAFLDWLAVATPDEQQQLETVLSRHAHDVRPLIDAVSDAIHDQVDALQLPHTLLAHLLASGWKPNPAKIGKRSA
jgi:hypothetical protein